MNEKKEKRVVICCATSRLKLNFLSKKSPLIICKHQLLKWHQQIMWEEHERDRETLQRLEKKAFFSLRFKSVMVIALCVNVNEIFSNAFYGISRAIKIFSRCFIRLVIKFSAKLKINVRWIKFGNFPQSWMLIEVCFKKYSKNFNVFTDFKLISSAFDENYWLPLFIDTLLISSTWICFNVSF